MTPDPLDDVETRQAVRGLVEIVALYFEELVKSGFSRGEALALTISYQQITIGGKGPE